jgi:hypothetical protein
VGLLLPNLVDGTFLVFGWIAEVLLTCVGMTQEINDHFAIVP